jgi:toxin ParE1/3/4
MAHEIVWTEPAMADLEAIVTYIAEQSRANAERVGLNILGHAEILASFPYIGPVYDSGSWGRCREITYKSYRIFYR